MARKQNKKQSRQSRGISEFQMLEPRLFLSTTVMYRESGGTGYVATPFDDCQLTKGSDTAGNSWSAVLSSNSTSTQYGLIGLKNLFTLLPATDGQGNTLSISSAKLDIFRYNTGTSSDTIYVDRVTSNWMPNAAGGNETNVTYKHESLSPSQFWAGGGDISTSDYTTTNQGSAPFVNTYQQKCTIDITALMKDIYSTATNYGVIIRTSSTAASADNYYTTEAGSAYVPVVEITYDYVSANHTLTVNSGTGSGSYSQGTVVPIVANAAPTGQVFSCWTGDTQYIANVNAASTTFTMPSINDSVTATYTWINRSLTVNNGTGSGTTYHYGQVVNISATPQSGNAFYNWAANSGIANVNNSSTTFTMPNSDATIYANCSPILNNVTKLVEGARTGFVNLPIDDAHLTTGSDTADGNGQNITIATGTYQIGLLGIKDLFSQIPQTSQGQTITITSATLHLYVYQGSGSDTVTIDRVTSNWMTGAAGTNEADVTFLHRDKSASLSWAGGGAFSASDYTTTGEATHAWSSTYNADVPFDVTSIVQGIYSSGNNYGFVVRSNSASGDVYRTSENSTGPTVHPYLEVDYTYSLPTPMHALAVTGGTSSASGNNAPGYFWENQSVNIAANSPGGGQSFNMWIGDVGFHNAVTMLSWANQLVSSTTYTMPKYDAAITATYENTGEPLDWMPRWNYIANKEYGAETEPLTYQMFGSTLAFESDGNYKFVSQNSAYLACETNLPTTGYVEYGTTTSYGTQINWNWTNRKDFLHGFYLTGLNNNTTYHYRFVMTDERGNQITSSDATLTTATPTGAIPIAGGHYTTPYTISAPGYYMLTGDVTADYTAFNITASNVTLDLGGHTVIYDNVNYQVAGDNFPDYENGSSCGVTDTSLYITGHNIYNGKITQGAGANHACSVSIGYEPIFLHGSTGEVAGITAEYWGQQVEGIHMYYGSNLARFNITIDHGSDMVNREAECAGIATAGSANHNLVLRTRQAGITSTGNNQTYYDNEIYVDSVCTNCFGIFFYGQNHDNVYENRIFGGGYLMIGIGTVHSCDSMTVTNNFIHLQADENDTRWPEYGSQSGVNGIRQCWGGTNLNFTGNYLLTFAQDGGYARGLWAYQCATYATSNITYTNNIFKSYIFNSEDSANLGDGAVNITGTGDSSTVAYQVFTNNQLMSNFCNIDHGTNMYEPGCNARFIGTTITKLGNLPDYTTIVYHASGYDTGDQYFDTTFAGGAGFDYTGNGSTWSLAVGWSLHLDTAANAAITIKDASTQAVVFTGTANASGDIDITNTLFQYLKNGAGTTNYSYNIDSFYGGTDHYLNGVIVDALSEVRSL